MRFFAALEVRLNSCFTRQDFKHNYSLKGVYCVLDPVPVDGDEYHVHQRGGHVAVEEEGEQPVGDRQKREIYILVNCMCLICHFKKFPH